MAIDWKYFTLRPYIKTLPLEEQVRLFNIANEKSINHRKQLSESFTDISTSTLNSSGTGGDAGFFNPFCFQFNGNSDSVYVAGSEFPLNFTDAISISSWITIDPQVLEFESSVKDFYIVDKADNNVNQGYALYIRRDKNTGSSANTVKLRGVFAIQNQTNASQYTAQVDIQPGADNELNFDGSTVYNVITTFNGDLATPTIKLYINGVLVATKIPSVIPNPFVPAFTEEFVIGNSILRPAGPGVKEYAGKIDEVSIWDTELSADNISQLNNWNLNGNLNKWADSKGLRSNLRAWYRMGEHATYDQSTGNWTLKSASDLENSDLYLQSSGVSQGDRKRGLIGDPN